MTCRCRSNDTSFKILLVMLQVGRNRPLLVFAVEQGRTPDFLRAMIASGVQLNQRDNKGHTALEKLVRLPGISSACQRAHVLCAIVLLNHAAQPPRSLTVGSRNEACARCVAEYHDALVASVVRRTASSGQMPCCSIIADFLHLGVR
jgi:hypothetical protein